MPVGHVLSSERMDICANVGRVTLRCCERCIIQKMDGYDDFVSI